MFLKNFTKKMLVVSSLMSSLLVMATEYHRTFSVKREDGMIASYCGKRISKKVITYPVLVVKERTRINCFLYVSPVQNMRFDNNGDLHVTLIGGWHERIVVK